MRVAVTGCAGFIGSMVAQACLDRGDDVVGIDSLTDYYPVSLKRRQLDALDAHAGFELVEADLADDASMIDGVDVVFHLAGQPGVRASWADEFDLYVRRNITATQRLLERSVRSGVGRVVFSSSSSVYGNAAEFPVREDAVPQPFSPYGVTKLAAEHLCTLYAANHGLPVVSLRYFTVYGPGQRPDMALHRLCEAALHGTTFPLFGTGEQVRDFTYVGDVVRANLLAAEADVAPGLVANIGGGEAMSMLDLIELVTDVSGRPIALDHHDTALGDVRRTGASTDRARRELGWTPVTSMRAGVTAQWEWHRSLD